MTTLYLDQCVLTRNEMTGIYKMQCLAIFQSKELLFMKLMMCFTPHHMVFRCWSIRFSFIYPYGYINYTTDFHAQRQGKYIDTSSIVLLDMYYVKLENRKQKRNITNNVHQLIKPGYNNKLIVFHTVFLPVTSRFSIACYEQGVAC